MNFIYETYFNSEEDTQYKLQLIPSHTSMLASPELRPFASSTFLKSCVVKAEFDNVPIGMVAIMSMKLQINVSALTEEAKGIIFNGTFTSASAAQRVIIGGDTEDTITLRQFNGWITPADAANFDILRTEDVNVNGFALENVTVRVKQTATIKNYLWQRAEVREIVDQDGNSQGFVIDYLEDTLTVASAFDAARSNAGNVWQLIELSGNKVIFQGMQKRVPSTTVTLKSEADTIAEIEITHIGRAIAEQAKALDILRADAGGAGVYWRTTDEARTMTARTISDVFNVFQPRLQELYRQAVRSNTATISINGLEALYGVDAFDPFTTIYTSDTVQSSIDKNLSCFDFFAKFAENFALKCVSLHTSQTAMQINFYPLLDCIQAYPYTQNEYNDAITNDEILGEKTVRIAEHTIRGTQITMQGEQSIELESANLGSTREADYYVQTLFSDAYSFPIGGLKSAYARPSATQSVGIVARRYPTIVLISKGNGIAGVNEASEQSRSTYSTTKSLGVALEEFYLQYFSSQFNRVEEFTIIKKSGWQAHNVGTLCEVNGIADIAANASIGVLRSSEHDVVADTCKVEVYVFDPEILPA